MKISDVCGKELLLRGQKDRDLGQRDRAVQLHDKRVALDSSDGHRR